jgi:hypothetical protein
MTERTCRSDGNLFILLVFFVAGNKKMAFCFSLFTVIMSCMSVEHCQHPSPRPLTYKLLVEELGRVQIVQIDIRFVGSKPKLCLVKLLITPQDHPFD